MNAATNYYYMSLLSEVNQAEETDRQITQATLMMRAHEPRSRETIVQ